MLPKPKSQTYSSETGVIFKRSGWDFMLMALLDEACGSHPPVHETKRGGGEEEKEQSGTHEEDLVLPIGYRFTPEEDVLIRHYLANKVLGRRLPANIVRDIDLYQYDPDQLPIDEFKYGKGKEAYYFTNTQPNRYRTSTKNGYWKATDKEEEVFCSNCDDIVGFRKNFNFYWGQERKGEKSRWIMKEYRLHPSLIPADELTDTIIQKIERSVVCRIQNKEDCGSDNSKMKLEDLSPELAAILEEIK